MTGGKSWVAKRRLECTTWHLRRNRRILQTAFEWTYACVSSMQAAFACAQQQETQRFPGSLAYEYSVSPPPCDSGIVFKYYASMEVMELERSELLILSIQHESTHAYSGCNVLPNEQSDSIFLKPALLLMIRAKASTSWKGTLSF